MTAASPSECPHPPRELSLSLYVFLSLSHKGPHESSYHLIFALRVFCVSSGSLSSHFEQGRRAVHEACEVSPVGASSPSRASLFFVSADESRSRNSGKWAEVPRVSHRSFTSPSLSPSSMLAMDSLFTVQN